MAVGEANLVGGLALPVAGGDEPRRVVNDAQQAIAAVLVVPRQEAREPFVEVLGHDLPDDGLAVDRRVDQLGIVGLDLKGNLGGRHARCRQGDRGRADGGHDQRHLRDLALREKAAVVVDDHVVAIVL